MNPTRTPIRNTCAGALALLATAAMTDEAAAQRPERTTPITPRAIALAPAKPGAPTITVTSPDFPAGGLLANKFMQPDRVPGGENKSPAIAWSAGPAGTQSYVLFSEGEGETRPDPTVHWIVYNIPPTAHHLPQGVPTDPYIKDPAGAINGLEHSVTGNENTWGAPGYRGPNPPPGASHPYYFQVFALDTKLALEPEKAKRSAVIEAMKGHVLASGEIMVRYNSVR